MDLEFTSGLMDGSTMGSGLRMTCMDAEYTFKPIMCDMMDNLLMIRNRVLEPTNGQTVASMRAGGFEANNTALAHIMMITSEARSMESGRTVRESSGLAKKLLN